MDDIHYNLVEHGLVANLADWRFSSIHRYVRLGIIPPDLAVRTMMAISANNLSPDFAHAPSRIRG
ncbi:MAG: hypothetical protein H6905_10310 [Hyphomicrobiales bacterium]|nr:hypothetical protein [Hyphomicrobiales bacterium]